MQLHAHFLTLSLAALLAATPCAALAADSPDGPPRGMQVFVQAGVAEEAKALVIGATSDLTPLGNFLGGDLSLYWEASFGRWAAEQDDRSRSSAWITQIGITPVFRWYPSGGSLWFGELGIGANVILPIYRSKEKRFSTTFNFGDHLAIGRRFGDGGRQELALRFQHFSNAGIRRPNPGEDFLQLRYAVRF